MERGPSNNCYPPSLPSSLPLSMRVVLIQILGMYITYIHTYYPYKYNSNSTCVHTYMEMHMHLYAYITNMCTYTHIHIFIYMYSINAPLFSCKAPCCFGEAQYKLHAVLGRLSTDPSSSSQQGPERASMPRTGAPAWPCPSMPTSGS